MISQSCSSNPNLYAKARSVLLSHYYGRCFAAYRKKMGVGRGFFYLCPNILERKFREGIEIVCHSEEDGWDEWSLSYPTIYALSDALEQVRDVVARFSGTMEHLSDYSSWSPLYSRFREAGIMFPIQPSFAFDDHFWEGKFSSLHSLNSAVLDVQIWAMWMMWSLHCLALWDGVDSRTAAYTLPPTSCAHLAAARQALAEVELENEGAIRQDHEEYSVGSSCTKKGLT